MADLLSQRGLWDEAACFRDILITAVAPPPKAVVEFGSGGGNNAFHMKADFDVHTAALSTREVRLRLLQQAGLQIRIGVDRYNRDLSSR